jgi:hypothetical protein
MGFPFSNFTSGQGGLPKDNSPLLNVRQVPLPARLDATQVAVILGFEPHHIPVLIGAGLLKPLGKPMRNAVKYFAAKQIEEYANDAKWLNAATEIVYEHWQGKNARKTPPVLAAAA